MSDVKAPRGYKLVPRGTPGEKHAKTLFLSSGLDWEKPVLDGSEYYENTIYAVPKKVNLPGLKKTDRKAPKPVWSTKFLSIHPKSTKADLVKLLQETVDQLNETGTKLVAAQNKLASLKAKA